jgi:hypothetical protein
MKRSAGIIVVAILLAFAGGVLLAAGLFDRRMAIAQEDMAVLDFVDPAAEYGELEQALEKYRWVSSDARKEIRRRKATLQYWQSDYADLVEAARAASRSEDESAIDPEMQVLAANALYRIAQRGPQDRPTLLRNLDAAIRAYADALRAGTERSDVAFNYELAVRMRQEVGAGRRKALSNAQTDDTKTEPNMHGDPGEPPKELKVEQFKIRIPMDPREIKQSQEQAAGTGAARRKRG